MKGTATLCFNIGFLLIVQLGMGQTLNITLDVDNIHPKTAMEKVSDLAHLALNIDSGALDGAKKVTIHAKSKSLFLVLDEIAANQPFYYYIIGRPRLAVVGKQGS